MSPAALTTGNVIGIDRDDGNRAAARGWPRGDRVQLVHGNFRDHGRHS